MVVMGNWFTVSASGIVYGHTSSRTGLDHPYLSGDQSEGHIHRIDGGIGRSKSGSRRDKPLVGTSRIVGYTVCMGGECTDRIITGDIHLDRERDKGQGMLDGILGTGVLVGLEYPDGIGHLHRRIGCQHNHRIAVQPASAKGGMYPGWPAHSIHSRNRVGMIHREHQVGCSLTYRINSGDGRGDGQRIHCHILIYCCTRTGSNTGSDGDDLIGDGYRCLGGIDQSAD